MKKNVVISFILGYYYFVWNNVAFNVNSIATILSSTGNIGTVISQATYIKIIKATSSTITFNTAVGVLHLKS